MRPVAASGAGARGCETAPPTQKAPAAASARRVDRPMRDDEEKEKFMLVISRCKLARIPSAEGPRCKVRITQRVIVRPAFHPPERSAKLRIDRSITAKR